MLSIIAEDIANLHGLNLDNSNEFEDLHPRLDRTSNQIKWNS